MSTLLILIIGIPLIEIYLFIKIGSAIGTSNTIAFTIITALTGIIYARHEGFNTLKSALPQLARDEIPIYEIITGATIAFAAFLLILPGFATDFLGFLLIFPFTRKLIISKFTKKSQTYKKTKKDVIEGQYEDLDKDLKWKKKYKILAEFAKDVSNETPDVETYLQTKDNILKYNLTLDINSKFLKNKMIEVNIISKFQEINLEKKKSNFEITYAAIVRIDESVKDEKEMEQIVLSDVPNEIYPRLEDLFI